MFRHPIAAAAVSLSIIPCAYGANQRKAEVKLTGSYISPTNLNVSVEVAPIAGHQITLENAPWMLTFSTKKGNLKKAGFTAKEFAQDLPKSKIGLEFEASALGEMPTYKLVSFICTNNKTQCFREIYKGKVVEKSSK